jgi:RimJ/RimL family protein N-acetyltransferase
MEPIVITRGSETDAQGLLDYLRQFQGERCETVFRRDSLPSIEQEREWLSARSGERGVLLLARDGVRIIGMLDAWIEQPRELSMNGEFGMSLLKEYRGRGIGRKLMDYLISWAEERKLLRLELNVFSTNAAALHLYAVCGFAEDGRRVRAIQLPDGGWCDIIHMSRRTSVSWPSV